MHNKQRIFFTNTPWIKHCFFSQVSWANTSLTAVRTILPPRRRPSSPPDLPPPPPPRREGQSPRRRRKNNGGTRHRCVGWSLMWIILCPLIFFCRKVYDVNGKVVKNSKGNINRVIVKILIYKSSDLQTIATDQKIKSWTGLYTTTED